MLFSGCFALTVALLCELTEKPTAWLTAAAALCGALAAMLRNNMAYAAIVWLVLWLPAMRKKGRAAAIAMALALVLGLGGNAMLKAATHAVDGDMSEMLSVPIQQMARARLLESEKLTEEEKTAIDTLMPGEAWRLYDPTISDPVKFEFDTKTFRSNVGYYGGIWLSVGAKCPNVYLDALLMQTYSFFYPYSRYGVSGYYLQMGMSEAYDESWCGFAPPSSRSFFSACAGVSVVAIWRTGSDADSRNRLGIQHGADRLDVVFLRSARDVCGKMEAFLRVPAARASVGNVPARTRDGGTIYLSVCLRSAGGSGKAHEQRM